MTAIDTTVIVPCYNEAARLDVARFRAFVDVEPPVRLLLVDDGSTDDTARVLAELCDADAQRLATISLPKNAGKAEAVRAGVNAAIEEEGDAAGCFGYWDADLATSLDEILIFRERLRERSDAIGVLGSRVRLLGRRIDRRPVRHYLGRAFATGASLILGLAVYDTQCGAKLFRRTDATVEAFAKPFLSRWAFDVEIIARLRQAYGAGPLHDRLIEQPLSLWRDVEGSKLRTRHMIGTALDLLRIARRYPKRSGN